MMDAQAEAQEKVARNHAEILRQAHRDIAIETIKKMFPHGHPAFNDMMISQMELHDRKNKNYAGGGNPLGNFQRVANIMRNYPNVKQGDPATAVIGMVIKQWDNVLWAMNTGRFYTEATIDEHLADLSVYANILRCIRLDVAEGKM